jgi:hypothetical protein
MHANEQQGTAASGDNVWHELRNAPVVTLGDDRKTSSKGVILKGEQEDIFERLVTETDASSLMSYESIPRFRKRPGDVVIEGTNNTLIVLGTDRVGPIDLKKDAKDKYGIGSIDVVVGRGQTDQTYGKDASTTSIKNANGKTKGKEIKKELNKSQSVLSETEGDPDFKNDRGRILISQKTLVDKNFGLDSYNGAFKSPEVKDADKGEPAIVIKSDKVRLIARSDLQIIVTGFDMGSSPNKEDRKDESSDTKKWASITIKSNGDIVFTPADKGVIKLGGDDANLAVLCEQSITGNDGSGTVTSNPIIDTMGGSQGTGAAGQGRYAKKVLMK